MPATLAEKIIARAAGRHKVSPGEIVTCSVDLAMLHDSGGPRRVKPILEHLNARVWDPGKVVVITDHYVPAVDAESAAILDLTRKWTAQNDIKNFYDMQGICHVLLPERGHLIAIRQLAVRSVASCSVLGQWIWPVYWSPAKSGSRFLPLFA